MTRNLKALGLALFAVLAMAASAAQASNQTGAGVLTTTGSTLTGTQLTELTFNIPGKGSTKCATATFDAHLADSGHEMTVVPHYTGCKQFGQASTVHINGCDYRIYNLNTDGATHEYLGTTDLVCTTGGPEIITTVPTAHCRITYTPKTTLEDVRIKNTAATGITPHDIDLSFTITGIPWHVENDGTGNCSVGTGSGENATLAGSITFDADTVGGTTVGLTISDPL